MLHTDAGGWRRDHSSNRIHPCWHSLLIKIILLIYVITARFHAPEYIWPEKCSDSLLVTADRSYVSIFQQNLKG